MYGCERRARLLAAILLFAATLAACGGGGGGSPSSPATIQPSPTAPPSPTSSTTNASGTVVDDASGAPLSGVRVVLMPWAPCGPTPPPASITPENDGCPTPLPSPQATTNAQGQFTLNGAPNGHYLLVIGNDSTSTSGSIQATIHDNVVLKGGDQAVTAPTLPSVPTIIPPAWEANGDYRLATLNTASELPCYQAWQTARANVGSAPSSIDEWLLENVRAVNTYISSGGSASVNVLTSGGDNINGGSACSEMVLSSFSGANAFATDSRTLWFAGQYVYSSGHGLAEFPIDPRSYTDPHVPTWL
jgi:hypothetical protein